MYDASKMSKECHCRRTTRSKCQKCVVAQGRRILFFLVWFLEYVFPLQVFCVPYFHVRLRGGRQGAFDCELQFAIFNALRFLRLSALQLAHWICSLSPQFAPFTERCSFRRLQPLHVYFMPISCPLEPARLTILARRSAADIVSSVHDELRKNMQICMV